MTARTQKRGTRKRRGGDNPEFESEEQWIEEAKRFLDLPPFTEEDVQEFSSFINNMPQKNKNNPLLSRREIHLYPVTYFGWRIHGNNDLNRLWYGHDLLMEHRNVPNNNENEPRKNEFMDKFSEIQERLKEEWKIWKQFDIGQQGPVVGGKRNNKRNKRHTKRRHTKKR
jgi:hypothetical protein